MYIAGLVIPVPADRIEDYRAWAAISARIFMDYGCLEIVEAWEDDVPTGKRTDFRRAVAAEAGEKIVFAWQVWPDKASLDAAEERMHADGVLDTAGAPPFDAGRLILGCFAPIHVAGRTGQDATLSSRSLGPNEGRQPSALVSTTKCRSSRVGVPKRSSS